MKKIKLNILLGMFLLLPLQGFGQIGCGSVPCDFVNNGDFEQYSSFPDNISQIDRSCGWLTANTGTPDYLHGFSLSTSVSVPCNFTGYETDRYDPTKNAYAGILSSVDNNQYYLENVYTELNQTLLPNTDYTLTFDLSLADYSNQTLKISAYLDSNTSFISNNYLGINVSTTTGIFLLSPISVTNTNGWTTVTLNFNTGSKTGIKYLVLGGISPNLTNLNLTANTPIITSCNLTNIPAFAPGFSYHYLDNVSLKKSIIPTLTPMVICTGNAATLAVANPQSGVTYNWYATQTSTTPFYTGTSYITPFLTASTSYWVEAVGTPCRSEALVIVDTSITTSPILNYTMDCATNIATIQVTNPTAGATYTWYDTQTSTTILNIGESFTTPMLSTTTYWLGSSNACNSLPRVAITVNFSVELVTANLAICPGNTITFDVANPLPGVTYNWYDSQTTTTILGTGTSFTTPVLNTTTNYWVEAVPSGFVSCRTQAAVAVHPLFTTDDLEYSIDCITNKATIQVTNPMVGTTYTWYANQTSTTILGTGTNFITPTIPNNTNSLTYWVELNNICGVLPRVVITVFPFVQLAPSITTVCIGSTPTLTVANPQSGVTYNWYDSQNSTTILGTGTSFTTPPLNTNISFWVEAESTSGVSCRSEKHITVTYPIFLPITNFNYTMDCATNIATISVTNPTAGATYNWFANQNSTTVLGTGTSFTTPTIPNNTTSITYWVEASDPCFTGPRESITVNPFVNFLFGTNICPGKYTDIDIFNPLPGVSYKWYTTQTSTTPIHTGIYFTTPVLNTSISYWAEGINSSGAVVSCRSQALVTVYPFVQFVATNTTICTGNTAVLSVLNPLPGVYYKWYSTPSSTTPIYTGINFTTPVLNISKSYWVEGVNTSGTKVTCRNMVTVTVTPISIPISSNQTICKGQKTTLSVSNSIAGVTYKWYNSLGVLVQTNNPNYLTPVFNTAGNYTYTVTASNTCGTSQPTTVTVTVNNTPSAPTAPNKAVCSGSTVTLTATATAGNTLKWYDANSIQIGTGSSFTPSNPITSVTPFYVSNTNASGCESTKKAVTVTPILATCTNVSATQSGSTITATVQGSVSAGATASYVWTLTRPNSTTQTQTTTTNSVSFIGNTVVGTYNITVNVNATLNTTTCTSTCGTTLNFCTSSGGGFYTNSAGNIPYSLTGTGSNQQIIEHFQYNGTFNPSTAPVTYTWTLINGNGTIQATATTSSNTWDYTYPSTFCLGCGMTIQCVAQMNAPYSCSNYWSYNYVHGSSLNGGGGGVDPNPCESNPYTAGAINATPIGTTGLNYQFKANPPSVNGVPITTSYTSHWFISYSNVNGVIGSFVTVDANTANYTFPSYGSFKVVLIQFDGICGAETTQIITVRKPKIVLDPDIASLNKNTNTSTSFKVNLSPNPTNDGQVVIYWKDLNEEVKEENLIVTDLRGVVLHKSVLTTNPSKVDLGKLASGTYLYHLTDTNGTKLYDGKLVISKK